jgi:hypothetical protein
VRPSGSDSLLLGFLFVLAASSVGLKAAAGPLRDGSIDSRPLLLEDQLIDSLRAQGFSARLRPLRIQSSIVYATRGDCRLSVRDARGGAAAAAVFARDAKDIGQVRYLYRGQSYEAPPALKVRLGRLEYELLSRMGVRQHLAVPLALASSAGCNGRDFGLEDMRVTE